MIISHRHKFIFIKVPKTASTSVELYLSKFCGPEDIITKETTPDVKKLKTKKAQNYRGFYNPVPDFKYWGTTRLKINIGRFVLARKYYDHIPAALIRARVGRGIWDSYFKFCFERNPWDKAVSAYYWGKRLGKKEDQDFSQRIREGRFPNTFPIYSINDELAVDFVGRYENLREDLQTVCRRIGLPEDGELPVTKAHTRNRNESWQSLYSEEERDIVADYLVGCDGAGTESGG